MPRPFLLLTGFVLCGLVSIGCGGGSSSTQSSAPPPPPPAGDFSLAVESPTVTLQQGGAFELQGIQSTAINGFMGTVELTLSGLPAGVTALPPGPYSQSVAPGSLEGVTIQLAASATVAVGSSTVTVTGTSGSITHSVTFSIAVSQAAPFTIAVSPSALSLGPGSSTTVQVSATSNETPPPQLEVSLSNINSLVGVNIGLPQGFLTPTNPVSFFVNPTSLAEPVQNYPIEVSASDNAGNTSALVLPLTVSLPYSANTTPTRSTFARTDQGPTGMVYDESRKLVFVSVELLNEVVVLSSVDGHQVASIPVDYPAGIDESADGSAVYVVSPYFGGVTVIDPSLLQVVGDVNVPLSVSGTTLPVTFFQVATLSNGDVFLSPSANFVDLSKPPFYLWNPAANTFTQIGQSDFGIPGVISRSADHTKVLAGAGSGAVLYDAATNTFVGPSDAIGASAAISPNGSQIVSVGLQNSPTVFYDSSFNQLASLQLDAFPLVAVVYSLDGTHVFVITQQSQSDVATEIDTTTFSINGLVPAFNFGTALPFSGQWITTFAVDETNMLFGAAFGGVGFLDMSAPTSLQQPLPGTFLVQPDLASLSSSTNVQLNGSGFSSNLSFDVFAGSPPASQQSLKGSNVSVQSSNVLNATIPSGISAGPANVTLTRSDGFFEVMPEAVSFEPTILQVDANAGSPAGGDSIQIIGYGLDGQGLGVTIGGKAAMISHQTSAIAGELFPTERITLTTPAGTPGLADVTVTSPSGSATISNGFQYLSSAQVYPVTGALDAIVYDQSRQRLYISNEDHNCVEVFDLGTHTFLSPVTVGNAPTVLALTPDATLLAVANSADGTVSVINLATLQVNATYTALSPSDTDCVGAIIGIAPAAPHNMLVDLACTNLLQIGVFHMLNLNSGSLSCVGVVGCASNGIDITFDNSLAAMASIPNGTEIFLATEAGGGSDTPAGLLNLTTNTLTSGFTGQFSDAAACADGTVFAANFETSNAQVNPLSIMAYEPYADSGGQSLHNVIGEKLSPSGSLLFYPQDSGVDIFDVHTGRLAQHVVLPDSIPLDSGALALDETGTKMFLISSTGVTVAQLYQAPLSLATITPSSGAPGSTVTLRGSGFQNGATVTFGTSQATATFVDLNTLTVVVPSLQSGPVRVTVTDPNGSQYSLDDAFTVN